MDDERKDKLDYIKVEVQKAIAAHAGEMDELLRLMLGASFHGVSFEEIVEKERTYTVAIVIVDPGLSKQDIETVVRMVREFQPKPQTEPPAPSPEEVLKRLDDIQQQIDKLRADIERDK